MDHFAVHQEQIKHCKSTPIKKKKKSRQWCRWPDWIWSQNSIYYLGFGAGYPTSLSLSLSLTCAHQGALMASHQRPGKTKRGKLHNTLGTDGRAVNASSLPLALMPAGWQTTLNKKGSYVLLFPDSWSSRHHRPSTNNADFFLPQLMCAEWALASSPHGLQSCPWTGFSLSLFSWGDPVGGKLHKERAGLCLSLFGLFCFVLFLSQTWRTLFTVL